MGVSLTGPRTTGGGRAAMRLLAEGARRSVGASVGSGRRLAARLGQAELRAPAATFLLVPLLLGPQASAAALRDLLAGLLLFLVIERAVPPLVPASRGSLRELPWTSAAAAVLALAAAAAHGPGLLVLVLLVAGCEWARAVRPTTPLDATCLALGAALRVDAGALFLGGGRGALLPLLVGSFVALVAFARARAARASPAESDRAAARGTLDLVLLAAFSLVCAFALALAAELELLGEVPSPWIVLGWPLLAAAGLAVLAAADRPGAAGGRRVGRLAVALAVAWLATFTLAVRLGGSG
mgnify:CR=1 FL=1